MVGGYTERPYSSSAVRRSEDLDMRTPASPATILIIDDAQSSRAQISSMVEALGHHAITARSGLLGLRMLREHDPDLVLLDVVMPDLDGFKVAAAIKAVRRFVPLLMLTGLGDIESKRRGQAAGADDFLTKPVAAVELQIRIAAMLRIKALTDELTAVNHRLSELADTDALTGFGNRRAFSVRFADEHERARRYRRPLSLAIADIDHFKQVNDTHGHPAGDVVLQGVGRTLLSVLRRSDHISRVGGEEFAILAPETGVVGAFPLADRLRRGVEALVVPIVDRRESAVRVTVSVGVATWDGEGPVIADVIYKCADDALYRAKQEGRNRVVVSALHGGGEPTPVISKADMRAPSVSPAPLPRPA